MNDQVYEWVSLVDDMMAEFIHAKDLIEKNNHDFRKQTRRDNKQFIEATKEDLHNKGFSLQLKLSKRHDAIENELKRAQKKM